VDDDQLERIRTQIRAALIYEEDDIQSLARSYGMALTSGLTRRRFRGLAGDPEIGDRGGDPRRRRPRLRPPERRHRLAHRHRVRGGHAMIRAVASAAFAFVLALPAQAAVKIQEVTSPGGIEAWLVEERSIPFAAIEIRFRGGTSLDAPGKEGATNLMMALIEEGAGELDAQAFARRANGSPPRSGLMRMATPSRSRRAS
jgi:hypothetical protein